MKKSPLWMITIIALLLYQVLAFVLRILLKDEAMALLTGCVVMILLYLGIGKNHLYREYKYSSPASLQLLGSLFMVAGGFGIVGERIPFEWIGLVSMVAVAVVEEILFRGFVDQVCKERIPSLQASIILSGVIFGLFHLATYTGQQALLPVLLNGIAAIGLGILLSLLVEETHSLLLGMILHIVLNIEGVMVQKNITQMVMYAFVLWAIAIIEGILFQRNHSN